jgi:hypothetical protein
MLDMSFDKLRLEIDSAERFRDVHLASFRTMVERYHGPAFREDRCDAYIDDAENFGHEYLSLVLPRIIHDTPKFRVKLGDPMMELMVGKRLQIAINRWSRITKLRRTLERIATDMLFAYGVGLTVSEPRAEFRQTDKDEPYLPRVYRISPERFFIDPTATHIEDARYMGHCYAIDKSDLLAKAETDPSWDYDAITEIPPNTDLNDVRDDSGRNGQDRQEMGVYEVWVPEMGNDLAEQLDDAMGQSMVNGTIYTFVKGRSKTTKFDGYIRAPMPYFGPRNGPYTMFGVYTVPDDPYPLSPLMAIQSQVTDLNAHLASVRSSAAAYKRLIMVDSRNHKLAQDLKDRPHDYIVLSESLDKDKVVNLEVGGITQQQVQYSQMAQDRLDRVSGIHDAMRGNISGTATATEVAVAESSATMRMAHLKRQFQEAVDDLGRSVLWFMWHDDRIVFPLGREGAERLMEAAPLFQGGVRASGWEDLEVAVDAYSMERVSEALVQKRAMELLQITTSVAQGMMTMPFIKWGEILSTVGDALNMPHLADAIDQQGMAAAMQQQQQQQQQPAPPSGGGAMPPSGGGPPRNAMNEPSPIPASSLAGIQGAANRGMR